MSETAALWALLAEVIFLTPISIYYWYGKDLTLRRKRILLVVGGVGFFVIMIVAVILDYVR